MNKLIGIIGYSTGENSFGAAKSYVDWAMQFGTAVVIAPTDEAREEFDLIIGPGGPDVNPSSYNAVPGMFTSRSEPMKEYFWDHVYPKYEEMGTPMFLTCASFQAILTKHYNCKMTQDFPFIYGHRSKGEIVEYLVPVNWDFGKTFNTDKQRSEFMNKNAICGINSRHHQGIFMDQLSDTFHNNWDIIGLSSLHANLEVCTHKTKPVIACQLHAEDLLGSNGEFFNKMVRELLND